VISPSEVFRRAFTARRHERAAAPPLPLLRVVAGPEDVWL